jgi:hypothetical protein
VNYDELFLKEMRVMQRVKWSRCSMDINEYLDLLAKSMPGYAKNLAAIKNAAYPMQRIHYSFKKGASAEDFGYNDVELGVKYFLSEKSIRWRRANGKGYGRLV